MSLPYKHHLIPRAKELRAAMTPQEKKLWFCFLKEFKPRFQRQKTIGGYIADFFCAQVKLVLEIDGAYHKNAENREYDEIRSNEFRSLGIEVIRVMNTDVEKNFDAVCEFITQEISIRLATTDSSPPSGGGGSAKR